MSPELALVDPVLGEQARAWLPQPDDTLERVERIVRAHRMAASSEPWTQPSRRLTDRRSAGVAGGVAAAALVLALLVGVRVDLGGNPAGADTTEIAAPARDVSGSETLPTRARPNPPTRKAKTPKLSRPTRAVTPRRFVWAPVERASSYQVVLFRGSSLVFSADTTRAEVSIPASWRFAGRHRTLEPGEYRWYVWPVVSGRRASEAIVQAKLVVPPR